MPRRTGTTPPPPPDTPERIVDIDVAEEMSGSFLEYAYSVIYSRALPDARDGLKPVHRRILYQMADMGLRPDRGHVKCARVVGDVMGKLHPHGDSAIYDALVRLAQPWAMRLPLVDGHGNFGSLDDGPAAYRYTECRLAPAAMDMVTSLDEDVVDFHPNYDDQAREPEVLPAAFPNLLVNGASGIAVGMATNMAPHNLVEVVAAARYLVAHPEATLAELMRFVPGPDLPGGGTIVGLDGVREAYATGRGSFRVRATASVESVTPRRQGIVVTELPYGVGPERITERIRDLVAAKKLAGVAAITDLTDRTKGLRLVIEVKSGFNPQAVLSELYRLTPMEDSFAINNVALVDGRPRTLGLRELLEVYVEHRLSVVRRRTTFRRTRAADELHLVEGLHTAILSIDEVIEVIRTSDDTAGARGRLCQVFDLTETQATYILDMPLRRLTRYSVLEIERRRDELTALIAELTAVLDDDAQLRQLVADELADVGRRHGTPRRTILLESSSGPVAAATPLEVADTACRVLMSSTGLVARTSGDPPLVTGADRARQDVVTALVPTTARGEVGVLTSRGRVLRLPVLELPVLPPTATAPSLAGGIPLGALVGLDPGETVVTLIPGAGELVLGTRAGIVKRVSAVPPSSRDTWEVIALRDGDEVVGATSLPAGAPVRADAADLVFITSDAQLLRFPAAAVRAQGQRAAGVAGIRLAPGAQVLFFGAVPSTNRAMPAADRAMPAADRAMPAAREVVVVTIAGSSTALPGVDPGTVKVTPLATYPAKGRATAGVRCHRFLRGEDILLSAWTGPGPARAASSSGEPVALPAPSGRRDGSGTPLPLPVAGLGGSVLAP